MKKFSKLRVLYQIGFLQQKFDGNEFRKSTPLLIRSYLILLCAITGPLKYYLGTLFPQNDKRQFYLGNLYDYLGSNSRSLMGVVGKLSLH